MALTKTKRRQRKAAPKKRRKQTSPTANGKTRITTIRFSHELLSAIDERAASLGTDRTGLCCAVLSIYLGDRQDDTVKRILTQRDLDARQTDLFA